MKMTWIKTNRCETCRNWHPADESGHALSGECFKSHGVIGGVVRLMVTKNIAVCPSWKEAELGDEVTGDEQK